MKFFNISVGIITFLLIVAMGIFLITEDMGLNYRQDYIPFVCITCVLSLYIIFKYIKSFSEKRSAEFNELIEERKMVEEQLKIQKLKKKLG